MKKYILWDHDGVLVDTEKWYFKANQKALLEIGINLTEESYMYYMQNGISVWSIPRNKGLPEQSIALQRKKRDSIYKNYLITENIEIEGVVDTLTILKKYFPMAIITTSKKEDFELIHKNRNILDYMDYYLTLGDYKNPKPAPDPYLTGMRLFKANPDECVVVEDSARGLKSAVSADIDCIIIKNEFTKNHDFSGAKNIINKISELPKLLLNKKQ